MMNVYEIYFSPTGGTRKVAAFLAQEMNTEPGQIDLSDNRTDFHGIALTSEDVAVIAVPSYRAYHADSGEWSKSHSGLCLWKPGL